MTSDFLAGVIEGFYGPPWSVSERREVLGWMRAWGLNTYFYGPKDDLHHRMFWRTPYAAAERAEVAALIEDCAAHGVRFVYAMGPGLDVRYNDPADRTALEGRFAQLIEMGCRDFCLLFDDIPDRMRPEAPQGSSGVWSWASEAYREGVELKRVERVYDLQRAMLLRLHNPDGARTWIWVERLAEPSRWLDLRRALLAHA